MAGCDDLSGDEQMVKRCSSATIVQRSSHSISAANFQTGAAKMVRPHLNNSHTMRDLPGRECACCEKWLSLGQMTVERPMHTALPHLVTSRGQLSLILHAVVLL